MKRLILAALLMVLFMAAYASADPIYKVELSGDNALASCAVAGDGGGLVAVHMFLTGTTDVTAVILRAPVPSCWAGAVWVGDQLAEPWLALGDSQADIGLSIAFGECRSLPVYLGYINYFGVPASPCCELYAVGSPTQFNGTPGIANCSFVEYAATGGRVLINADSTCPCQQPLATQQSTWGGVKALYR